MKPPAKVTSLFFSKKLYSLEGLGAAARANGALRESIRESTRGFEVELAVDPSRTPEDLRKLRGDFSNAALGAERRIDTVRANRESLRLVVGRALSSTLQSSQQESRTRAVTELLEPEARALMAEILSRSPR